MKGCDNRHFQPRQKLGDIPASFPAEDSILVLEANDVEALLVQEFGGLNILADRFVVDLEENCRRILISVARVRHGDDPGLQLRAIERDRSMKIMGKGRDAAATGQMIADERNTLKRLH